ncbi:hypothetical protein GGQ57_001888 [Parabacteroides faecis]|uniref:Uncharacterized protein n=1 Tax=Parabacteroides faecis TaxID=1217282 RepID=A0ABR6KKF4_9BACT|nr:hypothetical protein [Parabacteroides faecis]
MWLIVFGEKLILNKLIIENCFMNETMIMLLTN